MALNPKQRRFAEEYLVDKHITKAAERAGYSKKTAYSHGHRLLKNAEIKALIEQGLEKLRQEAERRALKRAERHGITKERWLRELALIGMANMDDFATIKRNDEGEISFEPVPTLDRARFKGRAIKRLSQSKNGISIELHSKAGALEAIGKHFGWVKEHHTGGTNDKVQVVDEQALREALEKIEKDV